jgi:hypothetical protein
MFSGIRNKDSRLLLIPNLFTHMNVQQVSLLGLGTMRICNHYCAMALAVYQIVINAGAKEVPVVLDALQQSFQHLFISDASFKQSRSNHSRIAFGLQVFKRPKGSICSLLRTIHGGVLTSGKEPVADAIVGALNSNGEFFDKALLLPHLVESLVVVPDIISQLRLTFYSQGHLRCLKTGSTRSSFVRSSY